MFFQVSHLQIPLAVKELTFVTVPHIQKTSETMNL